MESLEKTKQTAMDELFHVQLCDNTWQDAQRVRKELEGIIGNIFSQLETEARINTEICNEIVVHYRALILQSVEYPVLQAYFTGLADGMQMALRRYHVSPDSKE